MEIFYDSKGRKIEEFDMLKYFHFTGARRKKYFMYKWARKLPDGWMVAMHLTSSSENNWCSLRGHPKCEKGFLKEIEIISSNNYEKLERQYPRQHRKEISNANTN